MVRPQAVDPRPGREVAVGSGRHGLLEDRVLEVPVLGDLELQASALLQALRPGPEDRAPWIGEAGGDSLREPDVLRERKPLAASHRGVVDRRGQGCAGCKPADQEGAPAEPGRALQLVEVNPCIVERVSVHRSSPPSPWRSCGTKSSWRIQRLPTSPLPTTTRRNSSGFYGGPIHGRPFRVRRGQGSGGSDLKAAASEQRYDRPERDTAPGMGVETNRRIANRNLVNRNDLRDHGHGRLLSVDANRA